MPNCTFGFFWNGNKHFSGNIQRTCFYSLSCLFFKRLSPGGGAVIADWFICPVKYSAAELWMLSTLHQVAGVFTQRGRFRRSLPPTVERILCSSDGASPRLAGALKSHKWPSWRGFWVLFMDIKLLPKCLTMSGEDWKWQTSEEAAARVEKWETMFPQERDSPSSPGSTNTCMLFWGERYMFAISELQVLFSILSDGWPLKQSPARFERL